MIKISDLKGNELFKGLTDAQFAEIEKLSKADEDQVINDTTFKIYSKLEENVEKISGIKREGAEKAYDYYSRVLTSFKDNAGKVGELEKKVNDLTAEKKRIEEALKSNTGDAELKNQLEITKADLNQTREQYQALTTEKYKIEKEYQNELTRLKKETIINSVLPKFQFVDNINKSLLDTALAQVRNQILGMESKIVDNGGTVDLEFIENGGTKKNAKNGLKPYTTEELAGELLRGFGVIKEVNTGRAGAGSSSGSGNGGSGFNSKISVDVSAFKSKMEARDAISRALGEAGIAKTSPEYQKEMDNYWKEVDSLGLPEKV